MEPAMIKRLASTALVVLIFAVGVMTIMSAVIWGIDNSGIVNSFLQESLPGFAVPKLF